MIYTRTTQDGVGMFEVVVGVGIFALAVVGLIGGFRFFLLSGFSSMDSVKAQFLVEEGFEAMRSIRDENYTPNISDLIGAGARRLVFSGGKWATTTAVTFIDGRFDRTVLVEQTRRDTNDDIVASGGTADPDTAKITVSVAWSTKGSTTTKSVTGYLTNLFE